MAEVKEVIFNRQLRRTTDYGAMLRTGPTPYGTGLVEVNSGGAALAPGRDLNYTTGHVALFSTFWLKNKSIATTTMVQLACNDIGTAWMSGAGSTGVCLYWTNELGVQKINAKLCWNAPYYINIDVTGIAEGLHTAAIVVKNLGAEIYLDGRKIGSATTANANYYTAGIALSGYENPTLYTSGIGMVLVRGSYIGPVTTGQMEELTSNPWQIFNPDKPLPPLSLAPHEVVTPRKSYMLGGSSPAPSTAAILTIPRRVRTTQPQGVVSVANGWCAYNAASQSLTGFGQTVSVPNTAPRATMGGICGGAVNVNFSPLKRLSIVEDTSSTFTLVGSFVRQDSGQHTFGFSSVTG
jgi:hypothetical protein